MKNLKLNLNSIINKKRARQPRTSQNSDEDRSIRISPLKVDFYGDGSDTGKRVVLVSKHE